MDHLVMAKTVAPNSRKRIPEAKDSDNRQRNGSCTTSWIQPPIVFGWLALIVGLIWSYFGTIAELVRRWSNEPDYSHGFLIPVFAGYLLWTRQNLWSPGPVKGAWLGLPLLAAAGFMRWYSVMSFYPLMDAPSLIPCLAGATLLIGGTAAFRCAWPSIAYLVFMMPLPGAIANLLSHPLQRIATISSTWLLQLFGLPAVAQGNVIQLPAGSIGVVEACSGLRMLMVFMAVTTLAAFLIQRPIWEKILVSVSAVGIAVVSNICRITVTGFLYEYVNEELAMTVFHDMAGWLMMPLAIGFLWLELFLLSRILITPVESMPIRMSA